MHSWRVGDVDIVRIESVDVAVPAPAPVPDWMIPDLGTPDGEVCIAFSALAIRTPDTTIVVDPWLADDNPRDRPDADVVIDGLLADLEDVGFPAADVDLVVDTHCDGIGWNTRPDGSGSWRPTFPAARYVYPAVTLDGLDAGADFYGGDGLRALRASRDLEPVRPPHRLTPEVTLVDAPGHDPGHLAVRIASGDDLAVYPGHLVLSPFQVDDPGTDLAGESPDLLDVATATRRTLLGELADRNGLLLTTLLGGSGGGRVRRRDDGGFALVPDHVGTAAG